MRSAPRKVSVIIPARDAAATIQHQLDALAAQTYAREWELIVVDSASNDETAALAEGWSGPASLRVVRLEQPGMNRARNAGARRARGEFIVYCDSDDEVDVGWLSAMVAGASTADVIGGALDLEPLNAPTAIRARGWTYPSGELPTALEFKPFAFGASFGIWRDVLDAVDGWDEAFRHYTDVHMSWRVQAAGYEIGFAPDAVVHYRLRSSPGAVFRQQFRYARDQPRLYREFRNRGMPRSSFAEAARTWVVLALQVVRLRDRDRRISWLRIAGTSVGRAVGSVRQRVFYL